MRKILIPLLVLLTGCTSVANRSIRTTYASYNQTIAYNQSQQMLLNLVRLRYRELPMFLKVGALSSSISFEMRGGANLGRSFGDRVWGINAGSSYSTRPTITYTPIEGNTFVKQLLGEIDQNTFVLLFRSGWPIRTLCHVMVERIRDDYNKSDEPSYEEFLATIDVLDRAQDENRLDFVTSDNKVYIQMAEVGTALESVDPDSPQLERMVPFDAFQLRSLMDVMFYLAKNTEVPARHEDQVRAAEPNGWLNIRASASQPEDALVWVNHNDQFFSIASADVQSKDTFALVKMLFEVQAGDIKSVQPILTLPVAQP